MEPNIKTAAAEITRRGALLLFPINNKKEPPALWHYYYPRRPMLWEWTDDIDEGVPALWHLRAKLSTSNKVVYTKWYQGRATFLSLKVFTAVLSLVSSRPDPGAGLSEDGARLLEVLEGDSPLPTKLLREMAGYSGRDMESAYNRGMRELWSRLLIVGYGEVEEGGFPSLATGASKLLFEDLWDESRSISDSERAAILSSYFPPGSALEKNYRRLAAKIDAAAERTKGAAPQELSSAL